MLDNVTDNALKRIFNIVSTDMVRSVRSNFGQSSVQYFRELYRPNLLRSRLHDPVFRIVYYFHQNEYL